MALYIAKSFLKSFCGIFLLLYVLIFAWNTIILLGHSLNVDIFSVLIGMFWKILARLHQIIPLALLVSGAYVLRNLYTSGEVLGLKIIGYKYWVFLPGLVVITSVALLLSSLEHSIRSNSMLHAHAYFCDAGLSHYCMQDVHYWSLTGDVIYHMQVGKNGLLTAEEILSKPKAKVNWLSGLYYRDGHWWSHNKKLPFTVLKQHLKYGVLSNKDRPKALAFDIPTLLILSLFYLLSYCAWFFAI